MKTQPRIRLVLQDRPKMLDGIMRLALPAIKILKPCFCISAFVGVLMGTAAFAGDVSEPNIFHAALTHPDLALAVSAFEETCMPFVLHKTETTRETDKRHMAKLMTNRVYLCI